MADDDWQPAPRGHDWLDGFLERHGLRKLEDATPEQYAEWLAGHNEIRARFGYPPLVSGLHAVPDPSPWGPQDGHGDDLVEAPWPVGASRRGDPISPEAEAFQVECSRWQFEFQERHGLLRMDDTTAEQEAEFIAGHNEICARYGVHPL